MRYCCRCFGILDLSPFDLILALTMMSFGDLYGIDWKLLYESKRGSYYYERDSLERPANDIVRVWVAVYPSEDLILKAEDLFGDKFEGVGYWLELAEVHCRKQTARLISLELHSREGSYIDSVFQKFPTPWLEAEQWNVLGTHFLERLLCK